MNALHTAFQHLSAESARMSAVVLVLLLLRAALPGLVPRRWFTALWLLVAVKLLVPFTLPVRWGPQIVTAASLTAWTNPERPEVTPAIVMPPSLPGRAAGISSSPAPAPAPTSRASISRSALASLVGWLPWIWIAGAAALALREVWNYRQFLRRLPPAEPSGSAVHARVLAAARKLGRTAVEVRITPLVGAPATFGFLRPTLLFPPALLGQLSESELEMVVAHELSHHARRDPHLHALLQLARAVHWFNPLVWFAARAAREDCDLACDESAVRRLQLGDPALYGAALLKVACLAGRSLQSPPSLGIVESKKHLKRRLTMIVHRPRSPVLKTVLGAVALAAVAAASLTREVRGAEPITAPTALISNAPTTSAPQGWWKNGTRNGADYVVGVDREQLHDGQPSAYVKSALPSIDGFGGMMQMCSAGNYAGKRLRLSAWMKTADANDRGAHLWFRIDGREREEMLGFDNMDRRPVKGTTDWQQYSLVLDVPDHAARLAYGFFVSGTGQAWVSGFKIEEVGPDVPTTNMLNEPRPALPPGPVNLGFQ